MTEAEWFACADWRNNFDFIQGRVSDRKLRLFAVACCRATWPYVTAEGRSAVDVAERFADGNATPDELRSARAVFRATDHDQIVEFIRGVRYRPDFGGSTADQDALWAAKCAMRESADAVAWGSLSASGREFTAHDFGTLLTSEMLAQRQLLLEVVGLPLFRPVALAPDWRTSTVVALARQMYEARDFSFMPILADALQDAGCEHADILAHCRDPDAPHVRGCWVVDLALGKA